MLQFLVRVGIVHFEEMDRTRILNCRLAVGSFRCDANVFCSHPVARFQRRTVIGKADAADPRRL